MHERNPYKTRRPNFAALARVDADFAQHVRFTSEGEAYLDWGCPAAMVALTRTLLWHDFQIRWGLPEGRLCPTVPSRINYLLWLDDLLTSSMLLSPNKPAAVLPPSSLDLLPSMEAAGPSTLLAAPSSSFYLNARAGCRRVIDIGTGASCIYPLLGVALLGWSFLGTEHNETSIEAARRNVELNDWCGHIEVRTVTPGVATQATHDFCKGIPALDEVPVLLGVLRPGETFDACMCNPPFYDLHEQPHGRWATASGSQDARCAAAGAELHCEGGEVGFVQRIVRDSLRLRDAVTWYSSLLGRKTSLAPLLRELHLHSVPRIKICELAQGQTSRWVLAWSFVGNSETEATTPTASEQVLHPSSIPRFPRSSPLPNLKLATRHARKVFTVGALTKIEVKRRVDEAFAAHGVTEVESEEDDDKEMTSLLACGIVLASVGSSLPPRGSVVSRGTCGDMSQHEDSALGNEHTRMLPLKRRREEQMATSVDTEAKWERLFTFSVHWVAASPPTQQLLGLVGMGRDSGQQQERQGAMQHQGQPIEEAKVVLELCGGSAAAFWRFAEIFRNDIVRDTRKWRRRLLAREMLPAIC